MSKLLWELYDPVGNTELVLYREVIALSSVLNSECPERGSDLYIEEAGYSPTFISTFELL